MDLVLIVSVCICLVIKQYQVPRSGRRSFSLLLIAADRPFEIIKKALFKSYVVRQSGKVEQNHSLFIDLARFLHFLRGLATASRVNFKRQRLFGAGSDMCTLIFVCIIVFIFCISIISHIDI